MRAKQSMLWTGQVVCSNSAWLSCVFSLLNFCICVKQILCYRAHKLAVGGWLNWLALNCNFSDLISNLE